MQINTSVLYLCEMLGISRSLMLVKFDRQLKVNIEH